MGRIKRGEAFFAVSIDAPGETEAGEPFEVIFEVQNTGNRKGLQEVTGEIWEGTFKEFGETWKAELETGQYWSISHYVEPSFPYYDYSFSLQTEDDQASHTVKVNGTIITD